MRWRGGAFPGYTVIFEGNSADSDFEKITGLQDVETLSAPDVIEKSGSLFDGWYSSENFDAGTIPAFAKQSFATNLLIILVIIKRRDI